MSFASHEFRRLFPPVAGKVLPVLLTSVLGMMLGFGPARRGPQTSRRPIKQARTRPPKSQRTRWWSTT